MHCNHHLLSFSSTPKDKDTRLLSLCFLGAREIQQTKKVNLSTNILQVPHTPAFSDYLLIHSDSSQATFITLHYHERKLTPWLNPSRQNMKKSSPTSPNLISVRTWIPAESDRLKVPISTFLLPSGLRQSHYGVKFSFFSSNVRGRPVPKSSLNNRQLTPRTNFNSGRGKWVTSSVPAVPPGHSASQSPPDRGPSRPPPPNANRRCVAPLKFPHSEGDPLWLEPAGVSSSSQRPAEENSKRSARAPTRSNLCW